MPTEILEPECQPVLDGLPDDGLSLDDHEQDVVGTAFVQVAVNSPLYRLFDYAWPYQQVALPGQRVTVPFGRRSVIGIIIKATDSTEVPAAKIRRVARVHEAEPLIPGDLLEILRWASRYYQHPLGEVLATALPANLRKGEPAEQLKVELYRVTATCPPTEAPGRAPIRAALLEQIRESGGGGIEGSRLSSISRGWRRPLNSLIEKKYVERFEREELPVNRAVDQPKQLSDEQQLAFAAVSGALGAFSAWLLNGVTGSGKTEIYLQLIDQVLKGGQQVLVLVPEISLTPQLLQRFQRRLDGCLVSLHSAMNDAERTQNWLLAARGKADVVIGTRSAVFTPMPRLGLVIIDEEHDASLKQQDGFRYHARDLALLRARERQVPVLLGSATPSLESLHNVEVGRFSELLLTRRAANAMPPDIALLDIRRRGLQEGMSDRLIDRMREHLQADGQVLIFLNRRGFAPTLICNDCGNTAICNRCDANMTVHARLNRLRCHHCGAERGIPAVCESCGSARVDRVGYGTERIEEALNTLFPEYLVLRIDRDSTRRKGELQKHLHAATTGEARILVGTQMLAKGHHFPNVTLVGIIDSDRGLYGTDFRAAEQMGQLIMQVAGRAGREQRRGSVLVQTRTPDNQLLRTLVFEGYDKFARALLAERKEGGLPPYTHVCLLRAEAQTANIPANFLGKIADFLQAYTSQQQPLRQNSLQQHSTPIDQNPVEDNSEGQLQWFGPVPAPIERLAGRYRSQLLVIAARRSILNSAIVAVQEQLSGSADARRVRWSIDVDPVDLF